MYYTLQDVRNDLEKHLGSKEELFWIGQPKQGSIMPSTLRGGIIAIFIFWCCYVILWTIMACFSNTSFSFWFFGFLLSCWLPAILIICFVYDTRRRKNTIYGLTNKRVIIKSGIWNKKVKSYDLRSISDLEYSEKADGSGSVMLGPVRSFSLWGGYSHFPFEPKRPMLEYITEVKNVYNKIIELRDIYS